MLLYPTLVGAAAAEEKMLARLSLTLRGQLLAERPLRRCAPSVRWRGLIMARHTGPATGASTGCAAIPLNL